jgi:hypothetical protein
MERTVGGSLAGRVVAAGTSLVSACSVRNMRYLEWFADQVRGDRLLFDAVPEHVVGTVASDLSQAGSGLELEHSDAAWFGVSR